MGRVGTGWVMPVRLGGSLTAIDCTSKGAGSANTLRAAEGWKDAVRGDIKSEGIGGLKWANKAARDVTETASGTAGVERCGGGW